MSAERPSRPAMAFNGMVSAPHALATGAGLEVLQAGGGAVDAAIAANGVLTVVYPEQTSIGGDCFLISYEAATGRLHGFNGSGRAARAADRAALRAAGHERMPREGVHSVTVPGTVDAWGTALGRFGRFGLDRLLRPAIGYAGDGFPVSPRVSAATEVSRPKLERDEAARQVYLPGGRVPRPGERLRLPNLAGSLERIGREGRDAFYRGAIAERIVATARRLGSALVADDLANHRGEWVEALTTEYRGMTLAVPPPNSQGLTASIALNLAELVEPAPAWGSAEHLHPLIEATTRAFAVRDAEVTDPAFREIDVERLIAKGFARELWRSYDPARATAGAQAAAGDTVYVCAIDRDGNAASLMQSIYLDFGAGVVAEDTGILLQSRGAGFSLDEAHPNRLEEGKRTLHTLMPAMLLRDGELVGPIGTQGGDAQAQDLLQLVTNLFDYGMDAQGAIDAPRWVAGKGGAGIVAIEDRFPAATDAGLRARGHDVRRTTAWDAGFGHAQMILRDSDDGLLGGGADPRADGLALGH